MIFIANVRLSTILLASLLVAIPVIRRRWRDLLGFPAWFFGFEAVWEITNAVVYYGFSTRLLARTVFVLLGVACIWLAWRAGLRPWWPALVAAGLLYLVWLLDGFHSNPDVPFAHIVSWRWELENVGAKTLFGLAYLVPVLRSSDDPQGSEPRGSGLKRGAS